MGHKKHHTFSAPLDDNRGKHPHGRKKHKFSAPLTSSMTQYPSKRELKRARAHEKKKEKRDSKSDRSSQKIQSGKKYTRLQRFPTNSPEQKKILEKFGEHVRPEKFHEPGMMRNALSFMDRAVQNGPPTSPVEGAGLTNLQNLLGRTPEQHLRDFEAPYMRKFNQEIAPGIAERYSGANAARGSGFQNSIMNAGAGLTENLASLKGNLINQMLGQQTQAANVGLGYAQLPGQRYAQQMNAAQTALPASLVPQQQQQEMDRYAQNRQFQQRGTVLGTQPWGYMGVPPRGKAPTFWQRFLPAVGNAIQHGIISGAGQYVGSRAAGGGQPPAIQVGANRLMDTPTNNM
jgi:hypothetical protein